jgi:hypothetical protein
MYKYYLMHAVGRHGRLSRLRGRPEEFYRSILRRGYVIVATFVGEGLYHILHDIYQVHLICSSRVSFACFVELRHGGAWEQQQQTAIISGLAETRESESQGRPGCSGVKLEGLASPAYLH